jgi:glutamyl-tRNA(Gln) amidotransferase subunit D
MYSHAILAVLKKEGIEVGNRILLEKDGRRYAGLLMPKPEFGDDKTIIVKLDNGYNVGFEITGTKISRAHSKEPKELADEAKYELGRTKKSLIEVSFDASKPKVALVSTGGTIISRVDYATGGVTAIENPKELLHNIPELSNIAHLEMHSPMKIMSEDMDPSHWHTIANEVAKELNAGSKGAIVTHGTDTLHYTAAALSFFLRNLHKPVVIVGSQRSSDRGSSDAGMNLVCGAYAAVSEIAGVGVCMHGDTNDRYCNLIRGTKVRKMHTSRRDAFQPINEPAIARVFPDGKIEMLTKNFTRRDDKKRVEVDAKIDPNVAIVKTYPAADPKVIDFYVREGIKGFVIEGTGLGHVPTDAAKKPWTTVIKKHSEQGIPFVVTSQTIYGRVNPYVYTNLRKLFIESKAIPGEDMLTETAYVKLMWVLGKTKSLEKIREMMATNYAGEITKRTETNTFSPEGLND